MKLKYIIIFIPLLLIVNTFIQASDTLYDSRFKSWQEKANKGNAFSQYSLGNAYLRGNEVNIDIKKALHWFNQAAKSGHAKSEYKLGYMYYTGKGIKRNNATAIKWFTKAAKHDYSPAQFYLGKMYATGQGTSKNSTKALKWLNMALKNDYSPAKREIARIQKNLDDEPPVKATIVAKKPKTIKRKSSKRKSAKKSGKKSFDVAALLSTGKWMLGDKPAEILPSALSQCSSNNKGFSCKTGELNKTTLYAEIRYQRESLLTKLTSNGTFLIKAREHTIFVLPADADDPDFDPETIPTTGWAMPQMLICRFKANDKIDCSTDDYQKISFRRDI